MIDQEKLMAEMQKKIMEMANSGITDPNEFYKIQQEMMSQMTGIDLASVTNQFNDSFDEFLDDDDEAVQVFIEQNLPSKELEKYLALGSFLVALNYEPYQVMSMMDDKEAFKDMLASSWGSDDEKSARATIERIFKQGHRDRLNDTYLMLKNNELNDIDEEDIENYNQTYDSLIEFGYSPEQLANCNSIIAWDLDRAAFLARTFAHVGYFNEDEAWTFLKQVATEAKKYFNNWDDYAISLMMGRAVSLGFNENYLDVIDVLRKTDKTFLNNKSISSF